MKRPNEPLSPGPGPELLRIPFSEEILNERSEFMSQLPPGECAPNRIAEAQLNEDGGAGIGQTAGEEAEPALMSLEILSAPLSVIRPQDLLRLDFNFINLRLTSGPGQTATLIAALPAQDSYILVEFPPQHILEQSFVNFPGEFGVALKIISNPSRLVFKVPVGEPGIPFTLEGLLLALQNPRYVMSVAPTALPLSDQNPQPVPTVRAPVDFRRALQERIPPETAIELPYRLILSPVGPTFWEHTVDYTKATHNGRTELWHTRIKLASEQADKLTPPQAHLRAIWHRDRDDPPPPAESFENLPGARDREELVKGTADFTREGSISRVIRCERLSLSTLGGWLNARYDDDTENNRLEQWLQQTMMGRDQYVRVIGRGNLYPYGHRASFIEITERNISPRISDPGSRLVAFLKARKYIVIHDQEKVYAGDSRMPSEGRGLPFKRVRITIDKSPDITQEKVTGFDEKDRDDAFWPILNGQAYRFPLVAVDHEDKVISFEAPMIFVSVALLTDIDTVKANKLNQIKDDYLTRKDHPTESIAPRSKVDLLRQKVAFAPGPPRTDGSQAVDATTTFETLNIGFDATLAEQLSAPSGAHLPFDLPFLPQMREAGLDVPAVRQILGPGKESVFKYYEQYLADGFAGAQQKGEVFLQSIEAVGLEFSKQVKSSGGLVAPDLNIVGLSRMIGPVGGLKEDIKGSLDDFQGGNFDPDKFFTDDAKILGSIKLKDLMKGISFGDGKDVPQIKTRLIVPDGETLPTAIEAQLQWEKKIDNDEVGVPFFIAHEQTKLSVNAILRTNLTGQKEVTQDITCSLTDFTVALLKPIAEFVRIRFNEIKYVSVTGQKFRMDVNLGSIEFVDDLNFVQKLGELLNPGSRGPQIALTNRSLLAKFFFPIPGVTLGAFSLTNLSMKVGFELPFDGQPLSLQLGVSDRENPFLMTVGIFGGGGYFSMTITPDGLQALEMALEFGAAATFEIAGIASGRVFIMAGISYAMERRGNQNLAVVTGYLRCGGELRVLGIVTVSVLFYMALRYESATRSFFGRASLTVQIKIAFFSKSVTLSIERRFSGQGSSNQPMSLNRPGINSLPLLPVAPKIEDMMDQSHWQEYCEAFA